MAERARPYCEHIIVGDLDALDLEDVFENDRFDVVVAADVLEHLKDPGRVLRQVRGLLKTDGYLVASMPNVAHGSVRLALLAGDFKYRPIGLLDRTHLRFFTKESVFELFEGADFAIGHFDRADLMIDKSEVGFDIAKLPDGLFDALQSDLEARTYQFIVAGYPLPRESLHYLQQQFRELVVEADCLRAKVREGERRISELTANLESRDQATDPMAHRIGELETESASLKSQLGTTMGELADRVSQCEVLAQRIDSLTKQRNDARERLLDAHDELVRRDEYIRQLESMVGKPNVSLAQSSLANQDQQLQVRLAELEAENASRRKHEEDLQLALDRILYSRPGKVYRKVRSIVTLGSR